MRWILIFVALFLWKCSSTDHPVNAAKSNFTLVQNGKLYNLDKPNVSVNLEKKPFDLYFNQYPYVEEKSEWYALQMAATVSKSALASVKKGSIEDSHPFFGAGQSRAAHSDRSCDYLIVDNDGHQYLYYSSEQNRRCTKVKALTDGKYQYKIRIKELWRYGIEDDAVEIEKSSVDEFYLILFCNYDLDKSIDEGEYTIVQVRLN